MGAHAWFMAYWHWNQSRIFAHDWWNKVILHQETVDTIFRFIISSGFKMWNHLQNGFEIMEDSSSEKFSSRELGTSNSYKSYRPLQKHLSIVTKIRRNWPENETINNVKIYYTKANLVLQGNYRLHRNYLAATVKWLSPSQRQLMLPSSNFMLNTRYTTSIQFRSAIFIIHIS